MRRRLLIDVFFATFLQSTSFLERRDIVERRRDLKTNTLQRRHKVVCLLGGCTSVVVVFINWFVKTGYDALGTRLKSFETKLP